MPKVNTIINTFTTLASSSFRTSTPRRAVLTGTGSFVDDQGATLTKTVRVEFPFGPQDLEYANYDANFSQVSRPYRRPLLVYENPNLRTITFKAVVADKASGGITNIQPILDDLETISRFGLSCKFTYGLVSLNFSVALTKLSYTVRLRNTDGDPVRAEVSIQLTELPYRNQEIVLLNAVYRTPSITPTIAGGGDGSSAPPNNNWIPDNVILTPGPTESTSWWIL